MKLTLNGQPFELDEDATLQAIISALELQGKRYAIEVNESIIPRSEHSNYPLNPGDNVEVVQAIGGG